jgi:hypothetical protein
MTNQLLAINSDERLALPGSSITAAFWRDEPSTPSPLSVG